MRLVDSCRSEKMKAYVPTQRMVYFLHKFEHLSTVSFLEMLALFGKRSRPAFGLSNGSMWLEVLPRNVALPHAKLHSMTVC
jgi:hypothetical protein